MKTRLLFLSVVLSVNYSNNYCDNSHRTSLSLFGYKLSSPIGISACPLTTSSKGVKILSELGYSVITYKTIRSSYCPVNSTNMYLVDIQNQLTKQDIGAKFNLLDQEPDSINNIAITNSYGINSRDKEYSIEDISKARTVISDGQVLIVSIYGSGNSDTEIINDFVETAKIAATGGAQIIEANLSCPNITSQKLIYKQPEFVYEICKAISSEIKKIPLIIKVGVFDNYEQTKSVILAANSGGAKGICGINTFPAQIVDNQDNPIYGPEHIASGISGTPIKKLALEFVQDARKIIKDENLNFSLLATGGVTKPEDFDELLKSGADIALCATAAIIDEKIAQKYYKLEDSKLLNNKKRDLIKELYNIGAIKIENIKLKSGLISPIYFDMRVIISYPKLLQEIAYNVKSKIASTKFDLLCGVPYAAVPLTTLVSSLSHAPMIMPRKEIKSYGTGKLIEGKFKIGDNCLVIEDVIVSGASILETVEGLEKHGLIVNDILVLIDREQGGIDVVQKKGYNVHAIFNISEILQVLLEENIINNVQFDTVKQFCSANRF